jgi:hypothetical protein
VILLDWIRQNEDEARRESEDNTIEVIESDLLFVSQSLGVSSTRRQSARTTSVLPAAVLWSARSAELKPGSGARPTHPCQTENADLCTMRDGTLPESTVALVGIPSGIPTALWLDETEHLGVQ